MPLHEAIAMASRNPAREIGLKGKGEIALGNDADLVVFSPELQIEQVFVAGVPSSRAKPRVPARDRKVTSTGPLDFARDD